MSTTIETFEYAYKNVTVQDSFRRITGLNIKGNEAAYIAFVSCLSSNRNLIILQGLDKEIKDLKQT